MDSSSLFNPISSALVLAQGESIQKGAETLETVPENPWFALGYSAMFVLAIFVLPFIVSHFIASALRMPSHSFRLGVMIAAIVGGLLFAWSKDFKLPLGADMKGGTNLVYNIVKNKDGEKIDAGALASALSSRLNPSGVKEMTIRPRGDSQIEITVSNEDELELATLKKSIVTAGTLQFRIVANSRDHAAIINLAKEQTKDSSNVKSQVLDASGKEVGLWVRLGRETDIQEGIYPLKALYSQDILRNARTGELISNPPLQDEKFAFEKWMQREGIRDVQVLMALENQVGVPYAKVGGDDLDSAQMGRDKTGMPVVEFRLNTAGADKMLRLTVANQKDGNFHRRMAIIMDGEVLSAPQLNSPISSNGQITGRFTTAEVEFLVTILRAGRLPATLEEKPASEDRVGAGLGATTIRKGTTASIWAIVATFACILLYYRFSGVVAAMALIINGLLIFGVMIFIGQRLTLPGLAGLVLTVGMSVDANVLIFERIREEKKKGSAPRMSIRNGFDRAFTTIIDSNLTTLIAAIVLYWIGTEQVRGFAVALIIGIATSMFTATFCSRIVFEMAEKLKLVSLSMSDGVGFLKRSFLGDSDLNFMNWQRACLVFSLLLLGIGITAVAFRGKDVLNIDFTGGTSVTFQLQEPLEADALRQVTRSILTEDTEGKPVQSTLVRVEKPPMDTVYTLVTSIEDVEFLSQQLVDGFAGSGSANLVTYRVKVTKGGEPLDSTSSSRRSEGRADRLVAYQDDTAPQETTENASDQDTAPQENAALEEENVAPEENAAPGEKPAATPSAPGAEGAETTATSPDSGAETPDAAADATPGDEGLAIAEPTPQTFTEYVLQFSASNADDPELDEADKEAKITAQALQERLLEAAANAGVTVNAAMVEVAPEPRPAEWSAEDDDRGYPTWRIKLPLDEASAETLLSSLEGEIQKQPKWLSLSKIGTSVAGEMQQRAIAAVLLSLVFIVAYIWFRFQKMAYGLAAVVALVHDVLITLGVLALCHWLAGPLQILLIEDFKIGLTEVAAFLTIIGYSLNDTIVVFDRIREVRGRSPKLTEKMINDSVNQTLSRTLLTSGTTLLTVCLLYVFGGEGIHAFAFALLIGVLVGTYSSIFVAAPVLLWISNRDAAKPQRSGAAG